MPLTYAILLCLHALAAALWVGGMATLTFAVRPAAARSLEPPLRLVFMCTVLTRFFAWVTASIALLLASGATLLALAGGPGGVPWSVHAMVAAGLAMVFIFGAIRLGPFRRLRSAVATREWAQAAAQLDSIRRRVGINLLLGVAVFVVAFVGRAV